MNWISVKLYWCQRKYFFYFILPDLTLLCSAGPDQSGAPGKLLAGTPFIKINYLYVIG